MKTKVDERFRSEARRLSLRFTCESCTCFDATAARCVYGFPTEPHREIDIERVTEIFFCKSFELA